MVEVVNAAQGFGGSFNVMSALASVAALGLFALFSQDGDDDDDSTPGGGLMQPAT